MQELSALVFIGVVLLCSQPLYAQPDEQPPNIVFIMADDLGYGHLGSYGQELINTPNLDRLAEDGVRFTQAYAGSPVCAPSRSVLMTGLHQGHASVRGNTGGIPLRPSDITLGEVLQEAGYATGIYGKWGLGEYATEGVPTKQGFDDFAGYLHQIHAHFYYPEYIWKNEFRWPLPGNLEGGRVEGDAHGARTQYAPDEILEHALSFIRSNADRPFFAYIPSIIPHVEVVAPEEDEAEYAGLWDEEHCMDPRPGYENPPTPKTTYAAMISHLDRNVGKVLGLLEELGLEENTLVVFTSDNGPNEGVCSESAFFDANGPLRGYKRMLYEGGIRVPTIARWPGKIRPGTVSDAVWHFADVLPTFADVAGATAPPGLDGVSVLPAFFGEDLPERRLYWEFEVGGSLLQAVRMGQWKGVRNGRDQPTELYDLQADISESNNIASSHPDIVQEIENCFEECRVDPRPQVEPVRIQGRRYR